MVTAYLFDKQQGKEVASWADSVRNLSKNQVLWLDVTDPSEEEEGEVREALAVSGASGSRLSEPEGKPTLDQQEGHLRVTAVAVSEEESSTDRETIVVDCFVGPNWVLTAHTDEIAVIEDFRARVGGEGQVGMLDAPSFLSTLLEWVVTSYLRAFDEIEATLEEVDVEALKNPSGDPEERIAVLVEARRRVGHLRRALAPHREIFAALCHSEFDPISSDKSAERFNELTAKVDAALAAGRDARDGIASSFDVLIVRTEHRTNEIMKVLTLASILLLPGALIAGVAGMNVNINAHVFANSPLFWSVLAAIILIALSTLGFARLRQWI
jgi:magnesium transporter